MEYLLIPLMAVISVSKMTVHTAFGKRHVKTMDDAALFYAFVFLFTALPFFYAAIGASLETWLYAAGFGFFSVLFQLFYTHALAKGPVSLVGLIVNFVMVFSVLYSVLFYGDSMTPTRLVGFLLILLSFFLGVRRGGKRGEGAWIFFAVVTLLANAGCSFVQKSYSETAVAAVDGQGFVACSYVVAAAMTFAFCLLRRAGGAHVTFRMGPGVIGTAAAIGVILSVYQVLNIYAVRTLDGPFVYPALCGLTIILSALVGLFLFKDKLNRRQATSLIIGTVAVVLLYL